MNALPGFPLDFRDIKAGPPAMPPRNIRWVVYREDEKFNRLVSLLDTIAGPALIFVNSTSESEELAGRLAAEGFPAEGCGPGNPDFDRIQKLFLDGSLHAVVTTHESIERIHHPGITLVIRYVIPPSLIWMLEEGKLAGRNGGDAYVVLLFKREDRNGMERLLRAQYPPENDLTRVLKQLTEKRRKNFGPEAPGSMILSWKQMVPAKFRNTEKEFIESTFSILQAQGIVRSHNILNDKKQVRVSFSAKKVTAIRYGSIEADWRKAYGELDKVEEYVFAPQCRLFSLLAILELPVPQPHCGRCDLCTGREMKWRIDKYDVEFARSVLECIAELREKFGKNTVIDVLLGRNTKNIRIYSLKSAPSYGSMAKSDKKQLVSLIEGLIEDGFLSARRGLYPTLELTYWGRHVIRDSEIQEVILPRLVDKTEPEKFNNELYESLRTVRTRLAKFNDVPTFQIVPDKILQQMALQAPADLGEMKAVCGIGETKLQKFGPAFLAAIRRFRHKGQIVMF